LFKKNKVFAVVFSILIVLPVLFGPNWVSACGKSVLSMSVAEDVSVLANGDAYLHIVTTIPDSALADIYRDNLAAPSNTDVGEEVPIPATRGANGNLSENLVENSLPVREEFYRSVRQEQKYSFGFTTRILDSSMIPIGPYGEFTFSVDAVATPQILSVTPIDNDGVWELFVGQKDESAKRIVIGYMLTKLVFAKMMLDSVNSTDGYEVLWVTRIKLPDGATLVNRKELSRSRWNLNFGGGTYVRAEVLVDADSNVVLTEKTFVTRQNMTIASEKLYEAFCDYRNVRIKYFLPNSAALGLQRVEAGDFERDSHFDFSFGLGFSISVPLSTGQATVTLTIAPKLTISGYIGWDFGGFLGLELQWFKVWFGFDLEVTASLAFDFQASKTWVWKKMWEYTLSVLYFQIGPVPVVVFLNAQVVAYFDFTVGAQCHFEIGYTFGVSFKAGVKYDDGWSPIFECSTWGKPFYSLDIQLYVRAEPGVEFRIAALFYDIVGPYVGFNPYIQGMIDYYPAEGVAVYSIKIGFKVNVGIAFSGWIEWLLGLKSKHFTVYDVTLWDWGGHWGRARTSTLLDLARNEIMVGSGVYLTGQVTCDFLNAHPDYKRYFGSGRGQVELEYSPDNGNTWLYLATYYVSRLDQPFAHWWVPSEGSYLLRATYSGDSEYEASTSDSESARVAFDVQGEQEFSGPIAVDGMPDIYISETNYEIPGWSVPGIYGYAAKFEALPQISGFRLKKVRIPAYYTGDGSRTFTVEIWADVTDGITTIPDYIGEPHEILFSASYRYDEKFTTLVPLEPINFTVGSIAPSGTYYVCIFPNSDVPAGDELRVGMDYDKSGNFEFPVPFSGIGIRAMFEMFTLWLPVIHIVGETPVESHEIYARIGSNEFQIPNREFCIDCWDGVWTNTTVMPDYAALTQFIRYVWRDPDGNAFCTNDYAVPYDWNGVWWDSISFSDYMPLFDQYAGRPYEVEVYLLDSMNASTYVTTDNFRVIKHTVDILFDAYPSAVNMGNPVTLDAQLSPPQSSGTMHLQYSTDNITWVDASSGTPSMSGFTGYFIPSHAGTYFLRAYWTGDAIHYEAESEIRKLTVYKTDTSMMLESSSDTVEAGTPINFTATINPVLENRSVVFQYSLDGATWFTLGVQNVSSTGKYDFNWSRVPEILYTGELVDTGQFIENFTDLSVVEGQVFSGFFIRALWFGDDDYNNVTSEMHYVSVTPKTPPPTIDVELKFSPESFSITDHEELLIVYIEVPLDNGVTDLDCNNISLTTACLNNTLIVLLNGSVPFEFARPEIGDYDADEVPDLKAYFNRTEVKAYAYNMTGPELGTVVLNVTGYLVDGTMFQGFSELTIIPAHDVAVTNVESSATVVGQGYSLDVNITAMNRGSFEETFTVTCYYGNGSLTPEMWDFFWSMGDVNRDGFINLIDIDLIGDAFGSYPGHPRWNPSADLNSDGVVDMRDVGICVRHQGYEIWFYYLFRGVVGTPININLAGLSHTTVAFTWDTTGLALGDYFIGAYTGPVDNDTDLGNNIIGNVWVTVIIPGDINGDFVVDIFDAILLANAFGSQPGSSNWNSNADINGDDVVDIFDAILLANHFNQQYP
jgi:hypothetical protein